MTADQLQSTLSRTVAEAIRSGLSMDLVYGIVCAIKQKTEVIYNLNLMDVVGEKKQKDKEHDL